MICRHRTVLALCCALAVACHRSEPRAPEDHDHDRAQAPTDRIAVPDTVRKILGIEFAAVERRVVAATLRLPGHFELLPQARAEHRTPMAGRVTIHVEPLQAVAPGTLLYTIDAPGWRALQRELGGIETDLQVTKARIATMQPLLTAHKAHEESLVDATHVMEARIRDIEATRASVGGQAQSLADAKVQLAQVRSQAAEAAEKHTETEATIAELQANERAARDRFQLVLADAAAVAGVDPRDLLATDGAGAPRWRTQGMLDVRARSAGTVDALPLPSGAWADDHDLVVSVTDQTHIRFRARALQSDLALLRPGLPARIVPAGANVDPELALAGQLQLGIEADPAQRTLDVFVVPRSQPAYARAGVAAFVEITTATGAEPELAIPAAAVMQDGLHRVFFRRDPADADKVIRVDADLGLDDGRWVTVRSGLVDGDQVVLTGAYELMLASSGAAPKGGHFHADGTFHADDHK